MTITKAAKALTGVFALAFTLSSTAIAAPSEKVRVFVGFKADQKASVQKTLRGAGSDFHYSFDNLNAFTVSVPEQALKGLMNNPNVRYVEEDAKRFLMSQTQPYGIAMVQADDLALQPASANRNLCIIDSGYDLGHEDLPTNNVNGTNDSGSGNWYEDQNSHGTHVAGTIAAVDNGLGVVGVMRDENVNLHIIKVFDANGWAYSSSLIDAAMECETAGANIISMSLGGGSPSGAEDQYFADANARGVLSIAAAGNDGNTQKSYPASYDSVMSVAAVDSAKQVASFSQQNDQVEISGPGVGVKSTVPMGTGSEASVTVDGSSYSGIPMEGSPEGSGSGPLVDCGIGDSTCPGGGGQVCLIQRGSISFADKVLACENGGGVAAVIYNNESGALSGTLGNTRTTIPSLGVSDTQGAELSNKTGLNADVFIGAGNYANFDGTSMATPHVSGVAALIWSNHTACSNDEIRNAMNATAEDLGSAGRDNAYGYGLVQARAAVDYLSANGCGGGDPVNQAPTASFTDNCTDLSCNFDGTGSSDSDGSIVSYAWDFGDGNTATGSTASHSFAAAGDYTVTLTVTDDAGATDTSSQTVSVTDGGGDPGGNLTADAFGYKVKGRHHIDVTWSGATSSNVDITVNGSVTTTANDGAWTLSTSNKGKGSYTIEVCEAGTSTCSASVSVYF
ncbi:MAG: S8 family serine peptidase [Gammaproteobacteria bacterium]|nr:S8 family serine peptidase [Gammaproteobacteria bacterium]